MSIPQNSQYAVLGSRGSKRILVHYLPSSVFFPIEFEQPIITINHSNEYILAASISKLFIWNNSSKECFQTIEVEDICFIRLLDQANSFLTVSKSGIISLWDYVDYSHSFEKVLEYMTENEVVCVHAQKFDQKDELLRIFCGFKNGSVRQIDLSCQGFHESERLCFKGSDWVSSICAAFT